MYGLICDKIGVVLACTLVQFAIIFIVTFAGVEGTIIVAGPLNQSVCLNANKSKTVGLFSLI